MKKILFSMMTMVLVVGMVGAGAFAYFYDVETSAANTFTAGTLNLELADGDEGWGDGVTATWASPANWAPGETVTATVNLINVGTVDAFEVLVDWTNPTNRDFLRAIQVTEMSVEGSVPPGTSPANFLPGFVIVYDANGDGKMSLWELITGDAYWPGAGSPWEAVMRDMKADLSFSGDPLLPPHHVVSLTMGYTFMTGVTVAGRSGHYGPVVINDLQDKTATFDVVFKASQEDTRP